jgi:hypothetical protein
MVGYQLLVQCSIHLGELSSLHQEKSLLVEKAPMSSIGFPVLRKGPWSVGQGGSPLPKGQRCLGANRWELELEVAGIHLQGSLKLVLVAV